jgi:hypothetical protein
MMGGRAFTLLKAGGVGPKNAKQVEIRLAILLKILRIARSGEQKIPRGDRKDVRLLSLAVVSAGYG